MANSTPFVARLAVFLISFVHVSNISSYVLSLRIGIVQWHFWLAGILVCLFLGVFSGYTHRIPRAAVAYVVWLSLFMVVCALSLLIVDNTNIALDGFIAYGWFFTISIALVFLVRKPALIKACGWGIVAAVLLLSVLTIMEFLNPDFQVIVDRFFDDAANVGEVNRAGALYENPNDNGTALVLGMFLGQFFLPKSWRFIFVIFVGLAVFGTVSRGSLTIWAMAVLISLAFGYLSHGKLFLRMVGLGFVGLLGFLLVSGQIPVLLDEVGLSDLMSRDMVERLSENFFTQDDGSTQGRIEAAQEAWRAFVNNPLTGIGIGASDALEESGISSHNQHLKIASELGVLGLLIYLGLGIVALSTGRFVALVFVFLYMVIGFTNHGMMWYTVYSVLLPVAVVFLPELQQEQRKKKTKKRRRRRAASRAEQRLTA